MPEFTTFDKLEIGETFRPLDNPGGHTYTKIAPRDGMGVTFNAESDSMIAYLPEGARVYRATRPKTRARLRIDLSVSSLALFEQRARDAGVTTEVFAQRMMEEILAYAGISGVVVSAQLVIDAGQE